MRRVWVALMLGAVMLIGCAGDPMGSAGEPSGTVIDGGSPEPTAAQEESLVDPTMAVDGGLLPDEPAPIPTEVAADTSLPPMLIYYLSGYDATARDLYVFDTETGENRQLTTDPDLREAGFALSPNRSQIAYSIVDQDDPTLPATGGLFVMNADGSGRRQISEAKVFRIEWTADGKTLIYGVIGTSWNDSSIIAHHLETGEAVTLTNASPTTAFALSPDGTRLVYTAFTEPYVVQILIANLDGSNTVAVEELPAQPYQIYDFEWSPDGSKVLFPAFVSDGCYPGSEDDSTGCMPYEHENIYIVNADGSGGAALVDLPERDFNPLWMPDGRVLFVSDTSESGMQVSRTGLIDPATMEIVWLEDFPPFWAIRSIDYVGECKGQGEISRLHYAAIGMGGDRALREGRDFDFAMLELQIRPSASGASSPDYNGIILENPLPVEMADIILHGMIMIMCKH